MRPDLRRALRSRELTKPAEQQGLFRKFIVERVDGSSGPGGKHEHCECFVLDVDHDPCARPALVAYAAAVEPTHPQLAASMRERYSLNAPIDAAKLCDLVLELAQAVDNAHEDIGGSRPQLTILREAVAEARKVKP